MGVLQGIIAALMGLYARDAGGKSGAVFDVAMYEPLIALLGARIAAAVREGVEPGRHGNRFPTVAPRNTYRTADGEWVALTAGTDDLVRRLFQVIDRPELATDPRFRDNRARVTNVEALDAVIAAWIAARSRDEVVEAFNAGGVSLAAVDGMLRVAANPHFMARDDLHQIDDDEIGRVTLPTPSPRSARLAGRVQSLGRPLGADNEAVYCEWLGLSSSEVATLRANGVV
jgi:crotonobetainyl-CoA:carnitine CoA-transferase CaiB-like acyl-CoA transferase